MSEENLMLNLTETVALARCWNPVTQQRSLTATGAGSARTAARPPQWGNPGGLAPWRHFVEIKYNDNNNKHDVQRGETEY